MAAAATYGIADDCAMLYEMNDLYRQESEKSRRIATGIVGDRWGCLHDFNSMTCWLC